MLHINKLKFGLKEKNTLKKFTQNVSKFVSYDSTVLNVGKKNKNDTKILVTIGPKSCSSDSILAISKFTNLFRINGSHNSINWHTNVSKKIKAICPNSFILLDIPGLKPRTDNKVDIKIKKNQLVNFTYCGAKTEKGILSIETTKPLPYVNDPVDEFSLSDGLYKFKFVKSYKNFIQGISTTEFILKPKKIW